MVVSAASLQYSHVASFVGHSLTKSGAASTHRPKVKDLHAALNHSASAASATPKQTSSSAGPSPKMAGRMGKAKTEINLLHAEQHSHEAEINRLDSCLLTSIEFEQKSRRRADKQREMMQQHRGRSVLLEQGIKKLQEELQNLESRPAREEADLSPQASAALSGDVGVEPHIAEDTRTQARSPKARSLDLFVDTQDYEFLTSPAGGPGLKAVSSPSGTTSDMLTMTPVGDDLQATVRPDDHQASKVRIQIPRTEEEPPGSPSDALDVTSYLQTVGKRQEFMSAVEQEELADLRRSCIRNELRQNRTAREAFRIMDLNNSGHISPQEFGEGIERLVKNWMEKLALRNMRHVFKLFDRDRKVEITFPDLFPEEAQLERAGLVHSSEDIFLRKYHRSKSHTIRPANWQAQSPEKELVRLSAIMDRNDGAVAHKKWMESTMKRLKSKGKGDARCRELVALHLPRGTGPRDRQGVSTLSKTDMVKLRQNYQEKVAAPLKDAQKTMSDMRELRKEQRHIIDKLHGVIQVEAKAERVANVSSQLSGMNLFGNKDSKANKIEELRRADESCGFSQEVMEVIHH